MISDYIFLLCVLGFFIGFGVIIYVSDLIGKQIDIYKSKRKFKEIISLPSGQVLKINLYEFDKLKGEKIYYKNSIYDWTVKDSSWVANELRQKKENC